MGNFPTSHVGFDAGVLSPTSFACERTCSAVVGTVSATNGSELAHESVGLSEVAVYIERLSRVGSLHQFLYYLQ